MNIYNNWFLKIITNSIRHYLVGPTQSWVFEQPPENWTPSPIDCTSLYLHVPFCRHLCPYCPYTKVPYRESLIEPYTQAAIAEVDWWADTVGQAEITSIYIGGGTPTLALNGVARILKHVRKRFRLTGDICIETNPADVNADTIIWMQDMGITLVSLGVQSFQNKNLMFIGRDYDPIIAEHALTLLTKSHFKSVNADFMFALPQQTTDDVITDLTRAVQLGVNQLTTYPLFTFPYSSVGKYLHLKSMHMPNLRIRREHYQAINRWCFEHGFERVSVWGFKRGTIPRYSSVTRDNYIGIGPGSGSHLSDGFVLNTFDLKSWIDAISNGRMGIALRMPFIGEMSGWWWLYWRFYDTRIPLKDLEKMLGNDAPKARQWLKIIELAGLAIRNSGQLDLTDAGAFWLHLTQNYFALNYVNTIWTQAQQKSWPKSIPI